jgi:hypothetical protein
VDIEALEQRDDVGIPILTEEPLPAPTLGDRVGAWRDPDLKTPEASATVGAGRGGFRLPSITLFKAARQRQE